MAQYEGDILLSAEIGEPVPGEDALYGNGDVLTVWFNGLQKGVGIGLNVPVQDDLPFLIQNTKVHSLGMKIDAAVKFVLLGVKSHLRPPLREFFGCLNHTCFGYGSGGP
jgi:hypothetical protein